MTGRDSLSTAILFLFFLGVWSEECKSVIHCEGQINEIPTCNGNSSVLECFLNSCEAINPAVQLNIEAYETAEQVLCKNSALREGFEGMFHCWMTAVSCSWMHLVAETAEATRQICIVRRKSMRSCKSLGDATCYDIIGNFTDALNAESACGAAQLIAHVTLVLGVPLGAILLVLRYQ